jgi:hypothetical protein
MGKMGLTPIYQRSASTTPDLSVPAAQAGD